MSEELGGSKRLRRSNPSSSSNGNEDSAGDDDDGKVTKGTWCKDEDDLLLDAVNKYGTDNWKAVSQVVVGRSAKQCRDRYKLKLDPTINHGPWSKAEDDRLMELAAEYGRAWTKIARHMPGRTENAVKSRISSLERSRTKDWTSEEDALLSDLRRKQVDFEQMVQHFPNRSLHAIKKRWETLHMDELARKLRQDMSNNSGGLTQSPGTASTSPDAAMTAKSTNNVFQPSGLQPTPTPLSYGTPMPMMIPFNTQQMPMVTTLPQSKFPPAFVQPSLAQPTAHPGNNASRLARHSTSMTVLLQVLGENAAGRLVGSPLREHSSFSLASNPGEIVTGSDAETPKQQLLQALGFFQTEQKDS